uniref:Protein FAR-RED IMPAIRED RESPONSE 1-like n=1 Tax=Nicotiana tabacum TaxID=4097 RepID=A0A1S3XDX7_TOBAC|nr:PREDICTED: protein FAR-RED IMPAIRED RESPONSE 1-like [Nicotiana tabacum]
MYGHIRRNRIRYEDIRGKVGVTSAEDKMRLSEIEMVPACAEEIRECTNGNFNDGEDHSDDAAAAAADDNDDDDDHYLKEEGEGGDDRKMSNEFNEKDLVIGPITRMRFNNKDVMFDFYKEYARLSGFCIVKKISNKKGGDIVRQVQYGCDRSTKPRNKYVTKRRNCRARINGILEENGSWRISKVVKKHNHQLEPALS